MAVLSRPNPHAELFIEQSRNGNVLLRLVALIF